MKKIVLLFYLQKLNMQRAGTFLQNMTFEYDAQTGNLLSRTGMLPEKENFSYDMLNRLVSVKIGNSSSLNISYGYNGNILTKSDVGNYEYSNSKPHAVMSIDNTKIYKQPTVLTSFNELGKVEAIRTTQDASPVLSFTYGPDKQLYVLNYTPSDASKGWIHYYMDDYELIKTQSLNREVYYLTDHVMAIRDNGGDFKYYVLAKDNLGSITGIFDKDGNKVFAASYDAWGKQTVTLSKDNMDLLLRGYCGHDMLNEFDLINMKGRLYDPVLGRFLSPDNYVQMPENSQNFNRYSYCLNNPLKYTDPSGELFFFTIFGAVTDFVGNTFKHGLNFSQYNWRKTKNAWDIDRGMFKGSFGQVVNKWTWNLTNSLLGKTIGQMLNLVGIVDKVTYLDGMAALAGVTSGNSAATIGHYSFGPKNYVADWRDHLFVHEYGHYIQAQRMGTLFLPVVGIPSFLSASFTSKWSGMQHSDRWFELDASKLGSKYFDKKYGSGADGYEKDDPNFFDIGSFRTNDYSPYINPRIGRKKQDKYFPEIKTKLVIWDFFL